jgi:hypothetical protein
LEADGPGNGVVRRLHTGVREELRQTAVDKGMLRGALLVSFEHNGPERITRALEQSPRKEFSPR